MRTSVTGRAIHVMVRPVVASVASPACAFSSVSCPFPRHAAGPPTHSQASLMMLRIHAAKITRLQIPRHGRQLDHQAIQLGTHLDLTAQATRLGQSKGQVQHVVLVVVGFLHLVVHVGVFDDDVAGAAGAGTSAGAYRVLVSFVCQRCRVSSPSISRSLAWAMSRRLSPFATSKV